MLLTIWWSVLDSTGVKLDESFVNFGGPLGEQGTPPLGTPNAHESGAIGGRGAHRAEGHDNEGGEVLSDRKKDCDVAPALVTSL